jgi:hypothetical protein
VGQTFVSSATPLPDLVAAAGGGSRAAAPTADATDRALTPDALDTFASAVETPTLEALAQDGGRQGPEPSLGDLAWGELGDPLASGLLS